MRTSTPGTTDASAYRLPTTVLPHAYRLTLTPDLGAATFTGEVEIDVTVDTATDEVVLNAAELEITSAEVVPAGAGALPAASVSLDTAEERALLTFAPGLAPGAATLRLAFTGILNDKLRGFYLSKTARRNYAVTQFEPTDARRAFPSFDEPAFKASYDVSLVVDDHLAAYSNSPIIEETPEPGGRKRVHFGPTMVMSTYLVAFVVGPLGHTEDLVLALRRVRHHGAAEPATGPGHVDQPGRRQAAGQ